jgi:hypothetical protein
MDGSDGLFVDGTLNVKQRVKVVIGFMWLGKGNAIMNLMVARRL